MTANRIIRAPRGSQLSARMLWNNPASGAMRHADAGCGDAMACARHKGLKLPMLK